MNKSNHGKPDNPTTKKDKEKSKKKQTDEVPDYFLCPITLEIMKDPVISKCGHMFDREAIMKWMKGEYDPSKTTFSRNCPVCHNPIDDSSLSPCFPIKTAIEDHLNGNTVAVQETSKPITLTNKLKDKLFKRSSSAAASSSSASPPASLSRKSEKKGLDWNVFGLGLEAEAPSPGSSSSRRKEKDRGRQSSDDFGGTSSEGHVVATWALLEPLVYFHDNIALNREKYLIGRHATSHTRISLSEISSRHCYLWRQRRDDGFWEVYIEDRSTNGTFVNGNSLGKGRRMQIYEGDEIALGRKFTSKKEIPEIKSYLDWVFIGTQALLEHKDQVEKAKTIATFAELVRMTDDDLKRFGITADNVRTAITTATVAWKHDHRFPAYKLKLVDPDIYIDKMEETNANEEIQSLPVEMMTGTLGEVSAADYINENRSMSSGSVLPRDESVAVSGTSSFDDIRRTIASAGDLIVASQNVGNSQLSGTDRPNTITVSERQAIQELNPLPIQESSQINNLNSPPNVESSTAPPMLIPIESSSIDDQPRLVIQTAQSSSSPDTTSVQASKALTTQPQRLRKPINLRTSLFKKSSSHFSTFSNPHLPPLSATGTSSNSALFIAAPSSQPDPMSEEHALIDRIARLFPNAEAEMLKVIVTYEMVGIDMSASNDTEGVDELKKVEENVIRKLKELEIRMEESAEDMSVTRQIAVESTVETSEVLPTVATDNSALTESYLLVSANLSTSASAESSNPNNFFLSTSEVRPPSISSNAASRLHSNLNLDQSQGDLRPPSISSNPASRSPSIPNLEDSHTSSVLRAPSLSSNPISRSISHSILDSHSENTTHTSEPVIPVSVDPASHNSSSSSSHSVPELDGNAVITEKADSTSSESESPVSVENMEQSRKHDNTSDGGIGSNETMVS